MSTQLYGSEAWTMYCNHIKHLDSMSMPPCLLALPGRTVFSNTPSPYAFDAIPAQRQLHWVGQIIHMPGCCLPRQVLMDRSFQPAQNTAFQSCSIKLPADSDTEKVQHPPKRCQHQQINLFGTDYAKMGNTKQRVVQRKQRRHHDDVFVMMLWHLTQPYLSLLTQVLHAASVAGYVLLGLSFITTQGGIVPSHSHWQVQHSTTKATLFSATMKSQKKKLGCGQSYNQIIYRPIVAQFKYDVLRNSD